MRTPRSTAASRAGLDIPSARPASIQEPVRAKAHDGRGNHVCDNARISWPRTPRRDGGSVIPAPIPHPARSRGCSASMLRISRRGSRPHLARTFMASVVASGLFFAGEADAMHCRLRADAVKVLNDKFGESVALEKVSPDGRAILETWRNLETGTWTLLSTQIIQEKRISCIVAAGGGWAGDEPEKGEEL